jgi:hypothetical protein
MQEAPDHVRQYAYTTTQVNAPAAADEARAAGYKDNEVKSEQAEVKNRMAIAWNEFHINAKKGKPGAADEEARYDSKMFSPLWLLVTCGNDALNLILKEVHDLAMQGKLLATDNPKKTYFVSYLWFQEW